MATRTWTNGSGLALSAANLNSLEADLAAKAEKTLATAAADGLMPKADKAKLDAANSNDVADAIVRRSSANRFLVTSIGLQAAPVNTNDATRKDYVDGLIPKGYRWQAQAAEPTVYPLGISNFLASNADGWAPGTGGTFWQIVTYRNSFATGSTTQFAYPYNNDTDPIAWRVWKANATAWGPWQIIVTRDYIDAADALKLDKFAANMANAQDLNTYLTPGTWNVQANSTASGGTNYPVPYGGILEVIGRSDGASVVQRYTKHGTKSVWTRGYYGSVWSAWERMVLDAEVTSKTPLSVLDFLAVGDGTTNNNTAIQAAVDAANAQGRGLHWPYGTYVKTANITNFHTVRHTGQGVIKHGSDLFYVEPRGIQANTLYVSTSGASDTYDGLSASFPLRTVKKATSHLFNYGPVLQGFWAIQLAAGTYSDRVTDLDGLDAVAPPTIRGPIVNHPNVPTALFSEGYNIGAVAIDLSDSKTGFVISNIRFEGYNGTSSSAGVKASATGTETSLINCHFTDNYWGVTCQASAMDMKGGILTRNGYLGNTANNVAETSRSGNGAGYRGLMGSRHSIGTQNSGDLLKGPYFFNNVSGVFVQETCTGHVDWCRFEDNDFGVNANVNSRANVDGSSFLRNKIALRGIGNCHFFVSAANVFGTGADENGIPFSLAQGSQMTDSNRLFTDVSQSYNTNLKIIDTVFPDQTVQTTSLTTVYTATLAAYAWRDAIDTGHERKRLVFKVFGSLAGTAGTKSIVLRLGTANVTATFTATEVGVFEAEATIFFKDVAAQMLYMKASRHLGAGGRFALTQATNALTANTACTVEANVGVATDSVVINAIDVSWA